MTSECEYYSKLRAKSPLFYNEDENCHIAAQHVDVDYFLKSNKLTVEFPFRASRQVFGKTMLDSDETKHFDIKKQIAIFFSKSATDQYQETIIRPIIKQVLSESNSTTENTIDFNIQIAQRIPTLIIIKLFGFDLKHEAFIFENLVPLINYIDNPSNSLAVAMHAKSTLFAFLDEHLNNKALLAKEGILSRIDRSQFSNTEELKSTCLMLLTAGMATTIASFNILLINLYKHKQLAKDIENDTEMLNTFVTEIIRLQPPLHETVRFVKEKFEYKGVSLEKNKMVKLYLASANLDEAQFHNSSTLELYEKRPASSSFGKGKHACIGVHLAIRELMVYIQEFLPSIDSFELIINNATPQLEGSVIKMYKGIQLKKKK